MDETIRGVAWVLAVFGMVVWVGGATTSQIVIARAWGRDEAAEAMRFASTVRWLITRVYIPASIALGIAGLVLVWSYEAWDEPYVWLSVVVWLIPVVLGASYSLPGYRTLDAGIAQGLTTDPGLQRRLRELVMVNRIELAIVYLTIAVVVWSVSGTS